MIAACLETETHKLGGMILAGAGVLLRSNKRINFQLRGNDAPLRPTFPAPPFPLPLPPLPPPLSHGVKAATKGVLMLYIVMHGILSSTRYWFHHCISSGNTTPIRQIHGEGSVMR